MTTKTVTAWPRIQAVTRQDGTGEVIINGTSRPIETTNAEDAVKGQRDLPVGGQETSL